MFTLIPHHSQRHWGPWRLDRKAGRLIFPIPGGGGHTYDVDLRGCVTPEGVLDWVCHIADKRWADDAVLAGFVRAVNNIVEPRGSLPLLPADSREAGHVLRQAVRDIRILPVLPSRADMEGIIRLTDGASVTEILRAGQDRSQTRRISTRRTEN